MASTAWRGTHTRAARAPPEKGASPWTPPAAPTPLRGCPERYFGRRETPISYRRTVRPTDMIPGERHLCVREHAPVARIRAPAAADKPSPTRRRRAAAQKPAPRCPKALAQPSLPVSPGSTAPATTALSNNHGLGFRPARRLPPGHDLARGHSQPARLLVDADAPAKTSADAADKTRLHGRHRPPRPAARVARFYGTSRQINLERLRRETGSQFWRLDRTLFFNRAAEGRLGGRRRQGPPPALPEGPTFAQMAPIWQGAAHVQGLF